MTVWLRSISAVLAGGLLLAGCSSSGSSGGGDQKTGSAAGGSDVTKITVGTSPTLSNASLFLASQDGTFARHHLSVATQVVTSGAQAVPLLLNGQIQFTAADPMGAIVAVSKNVPLVVVTQGNVVPVDPAKDVSGLVVGAGSGISTAKDLAGKTIAVNALGSLAQVSTQKAIDAAGGDSSKVKFVEMPIPQMVATVKGGQVDGAVVSEPYVTKGKEAGLKDIMAVLSKSLPGAPMLVYLAAKSYVSSHPDVVNGFADSIDTANAVLSKNDSKIRQVGATSTKESADELAKIVLPTFVSSGIDLDAMKTLMDVMVTYKVLKQPIDVAQYIHNAS